MSIEKCISVIQKAAGQDKIDKDTAMAMLDEIYDFIQTKKQSLDPENLDAAIAQHLQQRLDDAILAAVIEKRNAVINTMVEARAINMIDQFDNPADGLAALMGGIVKSKTLGKLSIDAQGKALSNKYIGRLVDRLDKDGDLPLFNSGQIDGLIARELWEMKPGGQPGVTGNPAAQRIARHIHVLQETAIKGANQAGAYVKSRPGYIFRQSHDMLRLRKAGFDEWFDFIVDKLDHDATFRGEDPRKFLEGAFNGLQTGVHRRLKGGEESNHLYGFKGPANLAKKMSQERILNFKSADDFMEYNAKFGTGDLREGIVLGLEHMARNTALMRGLGTNPIAMLDRLKGRYLAAAQKQGDFSKVDALRAKYLDNLLKEIDGTTRIPAKLTMARVNAGIRGIQNMAKLGGATISSITDIANQAAELRYQGVPLFSAYVNALGNIFRGRGSAEQKAIARSMGIGFDGITGELMSRFSATDHVPGTMAKLQQKFFKLNLMSWWNDSHRTGVALMMSHNLGENANVAYANLGERLTNVLKQYGIESLEWDLIRRNAMRVSDNGDKYIVSEGLEDLTDDVIENYLKSKGMSKPSKRKIETTRDELISKLDTFYMDRADHGIPMPGAAERAIMNQGTEAGTIMGEAIRHIMQFKSFPITMIRRGIGRELRGQANGKADILGVTQLMVASTVLGYGAMYVKDVLKGRTPRTFSGNLEEDTRLMSAAMAQGGGLGIYGDFMFGEYSRYGRSFLSTLAGPTIGQVDDVAELWTRFRTGDDVAGNVVRMAVNNTPFINLFYTRAGLDYLFLYQLQETVNPGYLRRMENRIMRENDQRFYIPPSSTIPYGGGNRILEGVR